MTTAGAIATGLHRRPQTNIMRGQISPMGPRMRAYLTLPLTLLFLCGPLHAEWVSDDREIMGTSVRVELWFDDVQAGAGIVESVMQEMHRIDALMSTYKDQSEISRVNREAARSPVSVTHELASLVARSLEISRMTDGAFDITYASVGYLYDFRERQHPGPEQIEEVLPTIDYRFVVVDQQESTIYFRREGVRIDLGGIAKGYAVERGAAILRANGVRHGIVTAGGDSRIVGDRRGKPWVVGIRHPRDKQRVVTRMPLRDEAISTSGDYERFFEEDGLRYHHIIHPATGQSASAVQSVTIIGPDATMTDGLSTSVFVLGVANGLALIERLPDYECVIVDKHGVMHYSSGLTEPQ